MSRMDASYNNYLEFHNKLAELIQIVDENKDRMNWEDSRGELENKILYLIKNRERDSRLYIKERVVDLEDYYCDE